MSWTTRLLSTIPDNFITDPISDIHFYRVIKNPDIEQLKTGYIFLACRTKHSYYIFITIVSTKYVIIGDTETDLDFRRHFTRVTGYSYSSISDFLRLFTDDYINQSNLRHSRLNLGK